MTRKLKTAASVSAAGNVTIASANNIAVTSKKGVQVGSAQTLGRAVAETLTSAPNKTEPTSSRKPAASKKATTPTPLTQTKTEQPASYARATPTAKGGCLTRNSVHTGRGQTAVMQPIDETGYIQKPKSKPANVAKAKPVEPTTPAEPRVVLQREMAAYGLQPTPLARALDVHRTSIHRVLNGGSITVDLGYRLSVAFRKPAKFWIDLQADYDLWKLQTMRGASIASAVTVFGA